MRTVDENKLQTILQYINGHIGSEGRAPTIREIATACHIAVATVARYVNLLEERKLITKIARGGKSCIGFPKPGVGRRPAYILGACPCGEPIYAEENIQGAVMLPTEFFGNDEYIILTAQGNSMVKRGINDGDIMIVRLQDSADVGKVVIARVNGEEATAKILAKKGGKYYLQPANDEVDEEGKPLYRDIYPEGEWDIIGVVAGVYHNPDKEV